MACILLTLTIVLFVYEQKKIYLTQQPERPVRRGNSCSLNCILQITLVQNIGYNCLILPHRHFTLNCEQTNSFCTPLCDLMSRHFLMPSLLRDMQVLVALKNSNKPSISPMMLANILSILLNFLSWTGFRGFGPLELPLNF